MDCERMGRRTGGESARSIRDPYFSLSLLLVQWQRERREKEDEKRE
jgi:hypothetical protein